MILLYILIFVALVMVAPRIMGGLLGLFLIVAIVLLRILFKIALFIVVVGGAAFIIHWLLI